MSYRVSARVCVCVCMICDIAEKAVNRALLCFLCDIYRRNNSDMFLLLAAFEIIKARFSSHYNISWFTVSSSEVSRLLQQKPFAII